MARELCGVACVCRAGDGSVCAGVHVCLCAGVRVCAGARYCRGTRVCVGMCVQGCVCVQGGTRGHQRMTHTKKSPQVSGSSHHKLQGAAPTQVSTP